MVGNYSLIYTTSLHYYYFLKSKKFCEKKGHQREIGVGLGGAETGQRPGYRGRGEPGRGCGQ